MYAQKIAVLLLLTCAFGLTGCGDKVAPDTGEVANVPITLQAEPTAKVSLDGKEIGPPRCRSNCPRGPTKSNSMRSTSHQRSTRSP